MGVVESKPVSPALPIIMTIVWMAYLLVVAVIALFSLMIFDSGTDISFWAWLLVVGIWGSVILCPVSVVAGWVAWALTRKSGRGQLVRTIAYLLPLLGGLAFLIGWVGTDAACGGSLTC